MYFFVYIYTASVIHKQRQWLFVPVLKIPPFCDLNMATRRLAQISQDYSEGHGRSWLHIAVFGKVLTVI